MTSKWLYGHLVPDFLMLSSAPTEFEVTPVHPPAHPQARQRRLHTNYLATNIDSIEARIAAAEGLRESWRQWNPQREAAKKLEQMVLDGTITLEVRHGITLMLRTVYAVNLSALY